MEAASFQWMSAWCFAPLILGDARIFPSKVRLPVKKIGDMSTEMVKEFFYAISYTAAMNLHIKVLTPGNNHHMAEAMFKSFAKALDMAVAYDPRITDVLSTKGSL